MVTTRVLPTIIGVAVGWVLFTAGPSLRLACACSRVGALMPGKTGDVPARRGDRRWQYAPKEPDELLHKFLHNPGLARLTRVRVEGLR